MACKTSSWEDESNFRVTDLDRLIPLFEKWKWEVVDTEEWVLRFLNELQRPTPAELAPMLEIANRYSQDLYYSWTEKPDSRVNYSLEEREAFQAKKHAWYKTKVSELELTLCTLRTWMMNNYSPELKISKPLHLSFDREKKLHTTHRLEDRDHKVKEWNKLSSQLESKLKSNTVSTEERAELQDKIESLHNQVKAAKEIPTERLLKDRNVF
jgi:DNA repair exonuclease SbcCD ATPase subunit